MVTLIRRTLLLLIVLAALSAGSLGCNLTSNRAAPTPTITLIAGSPEAMPELVLPTATPGPTDTPLGGQYEILPTPVTTPVTLPTPMPPTTLPTPTVTETPDIASTGPLRITLLEFDDWRELDDDRVQWSILVHAVGGNGIYTFEHIGEVYDVPTFDVTGTRGAPIVQSITVRSGDGQRITCDYYVPGDVQSYFSISYPCGDE
jgi:hypothetical protein